jgi:hypothetical protein
MSDTPNGAISRRQLMEAAGTAALAAAAVSLAGPAEAAQPAPTLVPFTLTMTLPASGPMHPVFVIPVNPPIALGINEFAGTDPLLGQFSYIDYNIARFGVQGKPVSLTDGVGAFTAASGDALFVTFTALDRPPVAPFDINVEGAFTVTGGNGRFLGASGSGVTRITRDPVRKEITKSYDGTLAIPKPA